LDFKKRKKNSDRVKLKRVKAFEKLLKDWKPEKEKSTREK